MVVLRFLEKSEKVKVSISGLQERLEVPAQMCISIQQVAHRRGAKMAKRFSKSFGKVRKRFVLPAGPGGMRS